MKNDPHGYANKLSLKELVKKLEELDDEYHNGENSVVSDEIYDIMRDTLRERDPKNSYLKKTGAKMSKGMVDLPFYVPSLDKNKQDTELLEKWLKKYKGPYLISEKLMEHPHLFIKMIKELLRCFLEEQAKKVKIYRV